MNEAAVVTRPRAAATATPAERRAAPRVAMTCPAKLYDEHTEKYFNGRTGNLSDTGALILVQRTLPTFVGESFDVAIERGREDAVISRSEMIPATVVRVMPVDHFTQAVAVRFAERASLAPDFTGHSEPAPQAA